MDDLSGLEQAATTIGGVGALVFLVYVALHINRWMRDVLGAGVGGVVAGAFPGDTGNGGWVSEGHCHEIVGEFSSLYTYDGDRIGAVENSRADGENAAARRDAEAASLKYDDTPF